MRLVKSHGFDWVFPLPHPLFADDWVAQAMSHP
jgi:hypothetical protein